jgi:hypothetical protein|tara:strand:- start:1845 stop:2087 length:243 start_codon:yes stop_codon:yes gene_type:complete
MTIPRVIDKREIWLDALSEHAAEVLQNARTREERGLTRTQRERDLLDLCGGYLYLLQLAKEHGLFDSEDPFNLFNKETLH